MEHIDNFVDQTGKRWFKLPLKRGLARRSDDAKMAIEIISHDEDQFLRSNEGTGKDMARNLRRGRKSSLEQGTRNTDPCRRPGPSSPHCPARACSTFEAIAPFIFR